MAKIQKKKSLKTTNVTDPREVRRQVEEEFESHTLHIERYLSEVYHTTIGCTIYQIL